MEVVCFYNERCSGSVSGGAPAGGGGEVHSGGGRQDVGDPAFQAPGSAGGGGSDGARYKIVAGKKGHFLERGSNRSFRVEWRVAVQ